MKFGELSIIEAIVLIVFVLLFFSIGFVAIEKRMVKKGKKNTDKTPSTSTGAGINTGLETDTFQDPTSGRMMQISRKRRF
jgi:hypothetical protein